MSATITAKKPEPEKSMETSCKWSRKFKKNSRRRSREETQPDKNLEPKKNLTTSMSISTSRRSRKTLIMLRLISWMRKSSRNRTSYELPSKSNSRKISWKHWRNWNRWDQAKLRPNSIHQTAKTLSSCIRCSTNTKALTWHLSTKSTSWCSTCMALT